MEEKELEKSRKIVEKMYEEDAFSQWLGIEFVRIEPGSCTLQMTIREEMLNGFGMAHGGITFSFADSALAFASNSRGRQAVSVETSISHTKSLYAGMIITATAREENLGNRIAIYQIEVRDQEKILVALFKGIVYRTNKEWEV